MTAPANPAPAAGTPPRRRWPWVLLVAGALAAALMVAIWHAITDGGSLPLGIVIDGERVLDSVDLGSLAVHEQLLLALAATFVVLVVLLVVPLALLVALAGVLVAVALPLLVVLAALAILLSPLILLGWLLWRALRPSPSIEP